MRKKFLAATMAMCILATSMGFGSVQAYAKTNSSEQVVVNDQSTTIAFDGVDYIFLEKEKVSLKESQKIVIGLKDTEITDASLYYQKQGEEKEYQTEAEAVEGDTLLFSVDYSKASQKGIYILSRLEYEKNNEKYAIDLTKEKNITYGVECDADAQPDARVHEQRDVEIQANLLKRFTATDTNGTDDAKPDDANKDEANTKKSNKMVIVLDPGHGGTDPGATRSYNGITYYERDIVLKIANYCKNELKKYKNVEIHMTRTDNTSPLMDRWTRTQFALGKNADVIISFHINSTGDTYGTASGSLVYVPYADTESGAVSQELAKKILEKLEKLGLTNRGLMVNEGLGMICYPKQNGVPGILLEHAFINNASDVAKYLNTDAKLKKLGVADAKGIAEFYNLKKKSTKYAEYDEDSATMSITGNEEKTEYAVSISNIPKAYDVKFAVWNKKAGEETKVWYEAEQDDAKSWNGNFSIASFAKSGTYQVQAYVVNKDKTETRVATKSVKVKGPSAKEIKTESVNLEKGTFKVRVVGLKSGAPLESVMVEAWSESGKKDVYTYTAKLQKDGSYLATVNNKRHKYNYGTYQYYVYAKDKNGITKRFKKRTVSFERPSLNIQAKANKKQTKYTITTDTSRGIKSVRIAVWSDKKGQDDMTWYTAKKDNKGKWSASVDIAKHKAPGLYHAHVYGKTKTGQEIFLEWANFEVAAPTIKTMKASKIKPSAGTFYVYFRGVEAKAGIKSFQASVWSQSDKKDTYKYQAKKVSEGVYRIKVNIKNHNYNYGTYQIKATLKDNRGFKVTKKLKQELLKPEE